MGDSLLIWCGECCSAPSEVGADNLTKGCVVPFPITSKFRVSLTSKFQSHVRTPGHIDRARRNSEVDQENVSILMRLGSIRLKMIRCSQPYSHFEEDVSVIIRNMPERNGLDHILGEQHHGRKFCPEADKVMLQMCYEKLAEMLSTVQEATDSAPYYSLCADKFTILRNNYQGHNLKFMVNGVMQVVPIKLTQVDYSAGKTSKAEDLSNILVEDLNVLHQTHAHMREYISSMSFDGQYFKIEATKKLRQKLNLPPSCLMLWCFNHLIELCAKSAREENRIYTRHVRLIKAIFAIFAHCQRYIQHIRRTAGLESPKNFSEVCTSLHVFVPSTHPTSTLQSRMYMYPPQTKFVFHESTALKSVDTNYVYYYDTLEDYKDSNKKCDKQKKKVFRKLSSLKCVATNLFLLDLLDYINPFSLFCQSNRGFPWRTHSYLEYILRYLRLGYGTNYL